MANRLQEMRKAAGFSTAASLADACGIPVKSIRNYEQDVSTMPVDRA